MSYIKELRTHFNKKHEHEFTLGKTNRSSKDYSYFSLTPEDLKQVKLKFVLILDHKKNGCVICLSGQNKAIRKKYWNLLMENDWKKYHLADAIDNSLMIVDHTIAEKADFRNTKDLTQQIEKEALIFIKELRKFLA